MLFSPPPSEQRIKPFKRLCCCCRRRRRFGFAARWTAGRLTLLCSAGAGEATDGAAQGASFSREQKAGSQIAKWKMSLETEAAAEAGAAKTGAASSTESRSRNSVQQETQQPRVSVSGGSVSDSPQTTSLSRSHSAAASQPAALGSPANASGTAASVPSSASAEPRSAAHGSSGESLFGVASLRGGQDKAIQRGRSHER